MGKPKRKRPIVGIQLPETAPGKRSSTPFNKAVWAAAAGSIESSDAKKFVEKVKKEKNWRWGYIPYVADSMRIGSKAEDSLKMARAGWQYVYENMEYYRVEGEQAMSIHEAMESPDPELSFESGVLEGPMPAERELTIEYGKKTLKGDDAVKCVERWVKNDVIEQDTADVLTDMIKDNEWVDKLDDKVFVLLGGLSEMGPLQRLLNLGATVVAVDYCNDRLQTRLMKIANQYSGKLIIPMKPGTSQLPQDQWAKNGGADLLLNFPEVAEWLCSIFPERQMVIGSYCYLDGEMFIKITASCDAIVQRVADFRTRPVVLAYMATPTDCHLVPDEAVKAAYGKKHSGIAAFLSMLCKPGYDRRDICGGNQFTNCLVGRQGPNYALAKRLQTWRSIVSRENDFPVSMNVAPTTLTVSVVKNKMFAFGLQGMTNFGIEPFQTETTKSVMTALLINDVVNEKSVAHPSTKLEHPMQLLQKTQVHGGMYRNGLGFESMSVPAFFAAAINKFWWVLLLVFFGLYKLLA